MAARAEQAAGNLDEAKRRYGEILARIPHHAESMTMLASIAHQQGNDTQAEAYVDRSIEIYKEVLERMPKLVRVRAPLVNLLLARGRRAEAEAYMADLELRMNPVRSTVKEFTQRRRISIERGLPAMLINTLPKTASESIWNKLAEGLGMAQSHLSLGLFPDCCLVPIRVNAAVEGGLIAKEHLCATPFNVEALANEGLTKVVCHLRDPRQATLSWAHFVRDDVSMRLLAPIWRQIVPPASVVKSHFPQLLDWCIEHYLPLLIDFVQGWVDVSDRPGRPLDILFLTFERFHGAPDTYIEEVLKFYEIAPRSYRGEADAEVVHMRKGQIDEWRQVLTPTQRARSWELIPDDLAERFGWRV